MAGPGNSPSTTAPKLRATSGSFHTQSDRHPHHEGREDGRERGDEQPLLGRGGAEPHDRRRPAAPRSRRSRSAPTNPSSPSAWKNTECASDLKVIGAAAAHHAAKLLAPWPTAIR